MNLKIWNNSCKFFLSFKTIKRTGNWLSTDWLIQSINQSTKWCCYPLNTVSLNFINVPLIRFWISILESVIFEFRTMPKWFRSIEFRGGGGGGIVRFYPTFYSLRTTRQTDRSSRLKSLPVCSVINGDCWRDRRERIRNPPMFYLEKKEETNHQIFCKGRSNFETPSTPNQSINQSIDQTLCRSINEQINPWTTSKAKTLTNFLPSRQFFQLCFDSILQTDDIHESPSISATTNILLNELKVNWDKINT